MSRCAVLSLLAILFAGPACSAESSAPLSHGVPMARPATQPAVATKDVALPDVEGVERKPLDCGSTHARGAVVFFISHDCPISNSYAPEINRICATYGGEGKFVFSIVHPFPDLPAAEARKHAKEYGLTVPVFVDGKRVLTERAGVKFTPEVAVLSPDGKVLYRGRIDDKWVGYGKGRPEPTVRDLRNALDELLADKPVAVSRTDAVGCPIE